MATQQLDTQTTTAPGAEIFCNTSRHDAGLFDNTTRILNELVPLKGASHADVVEYRIEIPGRYAECVAILADGRKVDFANPRRFLGWSSHSTRRSLLFRANDLTLEVEVDGLAAQRKRSTVRSINMQAAVREHAKRARKFIGIDGGVLMVPA